MNEFTKEELQTMQANLPYIEGEPCELSNKIQSMIDNYCEDDMIISEKQIAELMIHAHKYINTLRYLRYREDLPQSGEENIESCRTLLKAIYNQQSKELKVIE